MSFAPLSCDVTFIQFFVYIIHFNLNLYNYNQILMKLYSMLHSAKTIAAEYRFSKGSFMKKSDLVLNPVQSR